MATCLLRILNPKCPFFFQGETDQSAAIQILPVHIHTDDPTVFVGGVIVDSVSCIATPGILGNLVAAVRQLTAPTNLHHRFQNVKELMHALRFQFPGNGI